MIQRAFPIVLAFAVVSASLCISGCTRKNNEDTVAEDADYEDEADNDNADDYEYEDEGADVTEDSSGNVLKDYINKPKDRANAVADQVEQRYRDMGIDAGLDPK